MYETKPSMRVFDRADESVGMGVLICLPQPGDEEGNSK